MRRFYMDKKILLDELKTAFAQFDEALTLPADNDVIKAGCIQYFEFTFELAWKTIKRFAEEEGVADCNSPKAALKIAFSNGWINDEELWLDMLMSRNKMSHTYNAAEAIHVFDRLSDYARALQKLVGALSSLD